MLPLAVLLFLQGQTGSFGRASTVGAALTFGWAVGAAGQARVIDRLGQRRPLLVCGLAHSACIVLLVLAGNAHEPLWLLVALGAAMGATLPQLGACMRALWAMLLPAPDARRIAYAWEAVTGELFFVIGPALVSGLLVLASTTAALLIAAGGATLGTLLFVASPVVRDWRPDGTPPAGLGPLKAPGVQALIVVTIASSAALGCLDVAVQARAVEHDARALGGVLITILSLGSVTGGLVWGRTATAWRPAPRFVALNAFFALALAPTALAAGLAPLAAMLLVAGLPIASLGVEVSGLIDRVAPPGSTTEAYGWTITAVLVGAGLGVALAGAIVDAHGPQLAFVAATALAALGTLLGWLRLSALETSIGSPTSRPMAGRSAE